MWMYSTCSAGRHPRWVRRSWPLEGNPACVLICSQNSFRSFATRYVPRYGKNPLFIPNTHQPSGNKSRSSSPPFTRNSASKSLTSLRFRSSRTNLFRSSGIAHTLTAGRGSLRSTSSFVNPVRFVNPSLISTKVPSFILLMLIASGLVRKAFENFSSENRSASSARCGLRCRGN